MPSYTAVQLRQEETLVCSLAFGTPSFMRKGGHGRIAVFDPGRLVGYLIESQRRARIFLFRTVEDPAGTTLVPGVAPRVRLLASLRSRGSTARLRNLLTYAARKGCDPEGLSDAFFVRAAAVLAGRVRGHGVAATLLAKETLERSRPASR